MEQSLLEQFRQAYRELALFPLITAEQIAAFRVNYNINTLIRLEQAVDASLDNGKIIFAGHRGCGKSTLLFRFTKQMQSEGYFVVFFSIADLVEMSDVNHVNILYSIALKLLSEATKQQIPIRSETRATLLEWFSTTETDISQQSLKQELAAGVDLLDVLSAQLKNESSFRKEIKKTYERRVSELARKADEIASAIAAATQKPILAIIDDLDKLDLSLVKDIYQDNINSLFLPNFRIVFTIPISALRNTDLMAGLQSLASRIQLMPVSKLYHQSDSHDANAVPSEKALKPLLAALEKRIPSALIEADTLRQIVLKSGGAIREVVRLARECCNECMVLLRSEPDRQTLQIDPEILALALKNLRNDFARSLGQNRYDILVKTYENFSPPDAESPEFLSLLHSLYILEYENDDLWYDVHPIVADLLKRKQQI